MTAASFGIENEPAETQVIFSNCFQPLPITIENYEVGNVSHYIYSTLVTEDDITQEMLK